MDPVALDLETVCFEPGCMAPPPVCASTYHPQDGTRIWVTDELAGMIERLLDDTAPILMHGGAYDSCCMLEWYPQLKHKLWAKYEADKVFDSIDTERIIEIATGVRGKLRLDELARRYGVEVQKSIVRTDFGRYYGRPLSEYTAEHKRYVGGDSAELHQLYRRQRQRGIASDRDICDLVRGSLWLRLCSNYGIRTDPERVETLETTTQELVDELTELAQVWGGMKTTRTPKQLRENAWFSRNMKQIKTLVLAAYGERGVPRTDGWIDAKREGTLAEKLADDALFGISTSKEVLEESGDPRLEAIADLAELLSVRNKDVKMLKAGVHAPIHTRFGYAATTRTTSSGPNLQNFRRKKGIRECLLPRPGCCFVETDYPSLELFTLAQVCVWKLGRRDLADNMNRGKDYHAVIGAGIIGTTYEDVMARKGSDPNVKAARDCGKYGNYGLCGYMTDPETFAFYVNHGSRTEDNPRGLQWTAKKADEVMKLWRRHATDPVAFLRYVDTLRTSLGLYDVEIPGTNIVRRGCTRTAAANSHFQGLGAVVAKRAGWKIAKAQYITGELPSRTVLFVHDSFVAECTIEDRNAVGAIQERCMAEAMSEVCPDMRIVPILDAIRQGLKPGTNCTVIDSAAMDHYSKDAKSKFDKEGNLVICSV
jgi:hypothetical protein